MILLRYSIYPSAFDSMIILFSNDLSIFYSTISWTAILITIRLKDFLRPFNLRYVLSAKMHQLKSTQLTFWCWAWHICHLRISIGTEILVYFTSDVKQENQYIESTCNVFSNDYLCSHGVVSDLSYLFIDVNTNLYSCPKISNIKRFTLTSFVIFHEGRQI